MMIEAIDSCSWVLSLVLWFEQILDDFCSDFPHFSRILCLRFQSSFLQIKSHKCFKKSNVFGRNKRNKAVKSWRDRTLVFNQCYTCNYTVLFCFPPSEDSFEIWVFFPQLSNTSLRTSTYLPSFLIFFKSSIKLWSTELNTLLMRLNAELLLISLKLN